MHFTNNSYCVEDDKYVFKVMCELTPANMSIVSLLINFVHSQNEDEQYMALSTLGNILSGDDDRITDHFIMYEGLKAIYSVLVSCEKTE